MSNILVYTDGGARGNPGIAGIGVTITCVESGELLAEISKYLGDNLTNNYAEYEAIYLALSKCKELGLQGSDIEVRADSKLAVEQLSGRWKVKDASIRGQFNKVKELLDHFASVKFVHIPRGENKRADELANMAMDKMHI
jgi:ribonuclease HI